MRDRKLLIRGLRGIGRAIRELDEALFPSNIYCLCCGSLIDRSRTYSLCDVCIGKFHWNTGRTCEKCGKALPEVSGGTLNGSIQEPGRPRRDTPRTGRRFCFDCLREEHSFQRGFSCLTYGLHERELMMDLKYGGKGYIAARCGDMMFDRMEGEILYGLFSPEQSPIDLIVPVPVGQSRLRRRGYNQAEWMAGQLARRWREAAAESRREAAVLKEEHAEVPLPVAPVLRPDLLERTRETRKLRSLNPAERRLELIGVFRVRQSMQAGLQGKRVLLIDDIYTTGATADACSKALLAGGAREVYLLTWAAGGNRRPGGDMMEDKG